MATEVLLMDRVDSLGEPGDIVNVADGYYRNYLMPKGLAAPVSDATRRQLVKLQAQRVEQDKVDTVNAQELAGRLQNVTIELTAKVAEESRLYGSITATDIVKGLAEQGFEFDRSQVQLEEPIKEVGVYDVRVLVRGQIDAAIKVTVSEG